MITVEVLFSHTEYRKQPVVAPDGRGFHRSLVVCWLVGGVNLL
jgi:hypothetical protein